MNADKILGLVGVLLAVVLSFGIDVPFSNVLLLILGIVYGFNTSKENHMRVIISAAALTIFTEYSHPSALSAVPQIGGYLHGIVVNIGTIAEGAALMIIFSNLYQRLKP